MADSDEALLRRYRRGQTEALTELVERYKRPLYSYILSFTGQRSEADDVFQEVWLRAIRAMPFFRRRNFLGWLFRIAHNLLVDRFRRQKETWSLEEVGEEQTPLKDRLKDARTGPLEKLASEELGERIRRAVAALTPDQREVFMMRTEGGLTFREIARIQRVSINTALGRMHYAVLKLRAALREDYAQLGWGGRPPRGGGRS